jgi:hypothetical protein
MVHERRLRGRPDELNVHEQEVNQPGLSAVSPADTLRVRTIQPQPHRCTLMYVTSICPGCRIVVLRSPRLGASSQNRCPGRSDRGARSTGLCDTAEGSVHSGLLIALCCRKNCLPVLAILVVRGDYAGQRPTIGRALLPQEEPRHSCHGTDNPCHPQQGGTPGSPRRTLRHS